MPKCGSQIILCDVPIRFDTYAGCDHGCVYCFSSRNRDIMKVRPDESAKSLRDFINGKRNPETSWCDWDIPIHWGGMSDPFQPIERTEGRSLECLKIFAETGYPFIVSTKNALIAEAPYLDLICRSNCVVQFSACSPRFNAIERGASTYEQRLAAAAKITPYRRVNLRVQPYIPAILRDVLEAIPRYAEIGIHGIILEGMKYQTPAVPGLLRTGNDWIYPIEVLEPQFKRIKEACHLHGLKFYCGENRLRAMSDELCCCGIEGLGWRVNTANENHAIFDPDSFRYTPKMEEPGTAACWRALQQGTVAGRELRLTSYKERMGKSLMDPYPFYTTGGGYSQQQIDTLYDYLVQAKKASGLGLSAINKHLGTFMAGHYFGKSQWCFPTPEAWEKLKEILPLGNRQAVLASVGTFCNPKIYGAK